MELLRKILGFVIIILGAIVGVICSLIKGTNSLTLFNFLSNEFKSIGSLTGDEKIAKITICLIYAIVVFIVVFSIISVIFKSLSFKGINKKYFKTLCWMILAFVLLIWLKDSNNLFLYLAICYGIIILLYLLNIFIGLNIIELNKTIGITSKFKKFSIVKYRLMTILTLSVYLISIFIFNIGVFDNTYKIRESINVVTSTSLSSLLTYSSSLYSNPAILFYIVNILSVLGYVLILVSMFIALIGIINTIISFFYSDLTFEKADYFKKLSVTTCNNFYLGFFFIAVLYEFLFAKSVYGSIQFNMILDDMLANLVVLGICFVCVIIINGDIKRLDKQFNKKEVVPTTYDPNKKLSRKEKKELAAQEAILKKEALKAAKKEEKKRQRKAKKQAKKEQALYEEKVAKREAEHQEYLEKIEEEKKLDASNNVEIIPEDSNKGDEDEC